MKFKVAVTALLVSSVVFSGGLRAAVETGSMSFGNNATLSVNMSNTNPNKIIIDGDLVTNISGPNGAYDDKSTVTTPDGALIIQPQVGQNFTVFLQGAHGSALSLNVHPQPGPGKTIRLTPEALPFRKNEQAKSWEEGQAYEKTLVEISRAVVNGDAPEGFNEYPARIRDYQPAVSVQLIPERQLAGEHLRVVRFRMKNTSYINQDLREKDFWKKGVRAVLLSTNRLYPGGEGYAWVIFSTPAEGGR